VTRYSRGAQRTTLAAVEPVYGTVIQLARLVWRVQGLKFTVTGVENLPRTGGAVVAINHTSYFDFTFAGLPAYKQHLGRKVRFMAKKEVFDSKLTGPIMRSLRHIEVDRHSGAGSFEQACRALKEGELVGVYPEATISRSFEIKEFKSGAARMAVAADVPIVPHIVWGAQRIWTKGYPKNMWRPKVPITVARTRPVSTGCRTGWAGERRRWPRPTKWMPRRPPKRPPVVRNSLGPPRRRGSGYGAGLPHAGDISEPGDQCHRDQDHVLRPGKHPGTGRRRDRDQPHELCRLVPGGTRGVSPAPPTAVHDQDRDAGREGRQLSHQAHPDDSGGP
jgi:1-acyl-sn-glycerol-3-phosphate acyltransferase